MPSKKNTNFPLPNDTASDFEDDHFLLTYKPKIDFIEPDQEDFEPVIDDQPETIDSLRDRTKKLINGLDAAVKLIDLAQERVDKRVENSGGMVVQLDEQKDAIVIGAMKRAFPDKEDPTKIDYDCYKRVIDCVNKTSVEPPKVTAADIQAARSDPFRTSFGGSNNKQGENRPEISSPASSVSPLDLGAFQAAGVLALFALMRPLIKMEDKLEIAQHLITTPHKPI